MATKRLNIELPAEEYDSLWKEAAARGLTISELVRHLLEAHRTLPSEENREMHLRDSLSRRQGSFDGPPDLAEQHDRYLYGTGPR
jgi:hypothetical protein